MSFFFPKFILQNHFPLCFLFGCAHEPKNIFICHKRPKQVILHIQIVIVVLTYSPGSPVSYLLGLHPQHIWEQYVVFIVIVIINIMIIKIVIKVIIVIIVITVQSPIFESSTAYLGAQSGGGREEEDGCITNCITLRLSQALLYFFFK